MSEPYGSDYVVIGDTWDLVEEADILDDEETGNESEPELPIN